MMQEANHSTTFSYDVEDVIKQQKQIQNRLQQLREEYPVQTNAALAVYRNLMAHARGTQLGEQMIDREDVILLDRTDGFAKDEIERQVYHDVFWLSLFQARLANKSISLLKDRENLEGILWNSI